ncbi:MAG: Type I Iterative PKS [Bathelium mastoideum]|nr:MAG: Type I Iterative PKS [Bathelium mastoideum]
MEPAVRPVAVIGLACRLPGGANTPAQFWDLLSSEKDAWSQVPKNRYRGSTWHQSHPNDSNAGTIRHEGGHFLDHDVSTFDAGFFGISAQEAEAMDPQQRLQLEVAYEAFENAGLKLDDLSGTNTAVYAASFNGDYDLLMHKDQLDIPKYLAAGTGRTMLSNRVSHAFNLKGPSITLDTGCSGSLVALHQACQSIRLEETEVALVISANLILDPSVMIPMTALGMLNPEGKSFSFDQKGQGYGRGEGVAAVVIKRYEPCHPKRVRAVVRSTAVGQDGKTPGITLPNSEAQANLILSAYRKSGLDPQQTSYVEAHGTGTVAGDNAEIEAIDAVFGRNKNRAFIGSVKANIGHLESASGLAGLIKIILMIEKRRILGNVRLQKPKDSVSSLPRRIVVNHEPLPWPSTYLRRASINSFGYGGTNAHAIVEAVGMLPVEGDGVLPAEAIPHNVTSSFVCADTSASVSMSSGAQIFAKGFSEHLDTAFRFENMEYKIPTICLLSAKSRSSLQSNLSALTAFVRQRLLDDQDLYYLAQELSCHRSVFPYRDALIVSTLGEFTSKSHIERLEISRTDARPAITLIFTGQGAQWHAMGRELMHFLPIFRKSLDDSNGILRAAGATWNLIEELSRRKEDSRLAESQFGQPATTSIQLALVDVILASGLNVEAVIGHSSGEIAAAYAVGVLSQKSAIQVSYYRGLVADAARQALCIRGGMVVVGLSESETTRLLLQISRDRLSLACINSPKSCTVSGDDVAIKELEDLLRKLDPPPFHRRIHTDTAYHSHHMEAVANWYLKTLEGIEFKAKIPSIRFISTVTGTDKEDGFGSPYWIQNLISPVKFQQALTCLFRKPNAISAGLQLIIEVGPHSALKGPVQQTCASLNVDLNTYSYSSLLIRGQDSYRTLLQVIGLLFKHGLNPDLSSTIFTQQSLSESAWIKDVPSYAWDHSLPFWFPSRVEQELRLRPFPPHELLGLKVAETPTSEPTWRNVVSLAKQPWLRNHVIGGHVTFPAAAFLVMAMEALGQIRSLVDISNNAMDFGIRDVHFTSALLLQDDSTKIELFISLTPQVPGDPSGKSFYTFRIYSFANGGTWLCHCYGKIAGYDSVAGSLEKNATISLKCEKDIDLETKDLEDEVKTLDSASLYAWMGSSGNQYGHEFAPIMRLNINGLKFSGSVSRKIHETAKGVSQTTGIQPGLLDGLIHSCVPLYLNKVERGSVMVTGIDEVRLSHLGLGTQCTFEGTMESFDSWNTYNKIVAFSKKPSGETHQVAVLKGVQLRSASTQLDNSGNGRFKKCITYRMQWGLHCDMNAQSIFRSTHQNANRGLEAPEDDYDILDNACGYLVANFLENYQQSRTLPNHLQRLLTWMQRYHANTGYSPTARHAYEGVMAREKPRSIGPASEAFRRLASNLEGIYSGRLEPLPLLMEDDILSRLYRNEGFLRCFRLINQYIEHLLFTQGDLVVLEIGAGTGNTARSILEHDSHFSGHPKIKLYEFTDISPGFFARAEEEFGTRNGRVRYRTLDICKDLETQGFLPASYDLVIATNVLHLTTPVTVGLEASRRLLKPRGKLLMVETTTFHPFMNIIFGVLKGWWTGVPDGRLDSPLLTTSQWDQRLKESGFTGLDAVADDRDGPAKLYSVMLSSAPEAPGRTSLEFEILLGESPGPEAGTLAKEIQRDLQAMDSNCGISAWPTGFSHSVFYILIDHYRSPLVLGRHEHDFNHLKSLLTEAARVLWITTTDSADSSSIKESGISLGMSRTARMENQNLRLTTLQVQDATAEMIRHLLLGLIEKITMPADDQFDAREHDLEYRYENGSLLVARLIADIEVDNCVRGSQDDERYENIQLQSEESRLQLAIEKSSSTFIAHFVRVPELALKDSEIEIVLGAIGLRSRGLIRGSVDWCLFLDCGQVSGTVVRSGSGCESNFPPGSKVYTVQSTQCANRIKISAQDAYLLPSSWSFADGASIPMLAGTAYHALRNLAGIESGHYVLVHGVDTRIGRAMVIIGRLLGAQVFASAKTDLVEKSTELPLPTNNVFLQSSDLNGQISDALNGTLLNTIVDCTCDWSSVNTPGLLADFGVFVSVLDSGRQHSLIVQEQPLRANTTHVCLDFPAFIQRYPTRASSAIEEAVRLLSSQNVRGLAAPVSGSLNDINNALQDVLFGQKSETRVLQAKDTDSLSVLTNPTTSLFSPSATYIIAGGIGGLGLATCRYLIAQGAKHIVLLTRRELGAEKSAAFLKEFDCDDVNVFILTCDISTATQVDALRVTLRSFPPVRGIFQSAMVIKDQSIPYMGFADLHATLAPKVAGTHNLLNAFCFEPLDFFLMYSSAAGVLGNPGQASYAAANTYLDLLAHTANNFSFPLISFCPGPIQDVGEVGKGSQNPNFLYNLMRQGYALLHTRDIVAALSVILRNVRKYRKSSQVVLGIGQDTLAQSKSSTFRNNLLFQNVMPHKVDEPETRSVERTEDDLGSLKAATSSVQAKEIVWKMITKQLENIVGLGEDSLDPAASMAAIGLDSLSATDLRNWVSSRLSAKLELTEILDASNVDVLVDYVARRSDVLHQIRQDSGWHVE